MIKNYFLKFYWNLALKARKEPTKQTKSNSNKKKECVIKIYFSEINKSLAFYIPRKCNGSLIRTPKRNRNSEIESEVFFLHPDVKENLDQKRVFPLQ